MTDIFKLQLQQPHENMGGGEDNLTFIFNGFFIDWDFRGDCGGDTTPATLILCYIPSWEAREGASVREGAGRRMRCSRTKVAAWSVRA